MGYQDELSLIDPLLSCWLQINRVLSRRLKVLAAKYMFAAKYLAGHDPLAQSLRWTGYQPVALCVSVRRLGLPVFPLPRILRGP